MLSTSILRQFDKPNFWQTFLSSWYCFCSEWPGLSPYADSEPHDGWACTSTQRSVDMVQLSHGPEVLTPTFLGHIHPLPHCKDRSPLSRALNPPQSAPLQHINSGTGTNCPTLDVLETHIASAASMPLTPQHSTPNRRKPWKEESQNCWFLCPVFW